MDPVCLKAEAEPGDEYCTVGGIVVRRSSSDGASLFLVPCLLGPWSLCPRRRDDRTIDDRRFATDSGIGHRNLATCQSNTNLRKHREISRFHAHLAPNVNETRVRVRVRVSVVVLAVDACGWCVLASRNSQLACKKSKTSRRRQDARK